MTLPQAEIDNRQAVTWHPPTEGQEVTPLSAPSRHTQRRLPARRTMNTGFTPTSSTLEVVLEEPEEETPDSRPRDDSSERSKPADDAPEPSESTDDGPVQGEPDHESEGVEEKKESDDDTQRVPAAVRQLYNSFTGQPHPSTQSRTRSGKSLAQDDPSIALFAAGQGVPTYGSATQLDPEPTTMREAQASSEWPQWKRAFAREMDGQTARGVWQVVERPKGKTVLGTKVVFKRKIGKDGKIGKYKCRLVAQGFKQVKGIHYDESSSPTPAQASIRMVLSMIAALGWEARQLDVDMAYLEADVEEEIYIELPEGYRDSRKQVGLLRKAMYGLVHAGLLWSQKFGSELEAKGFQRSEADPCVFRRILHGTVVVVIVVYVDDLLVASATKHDEEQAVRDLRSCFSIKDLGEASYYLGCHITRDRNAGTLKFDQRQYIRTVAERFGVTKTSAIPSAAGGKALSKSDGPQTDAEAEEMRRIPYREIVGALMWAATMTRPDISFAAHQLAKFNDNPGLSHWRAAQKALQYLWRTQDLGITYGGEPGGGDQAVGMGRRGLRHLPGHAPLSVGRSSDDGWRGH